MSAGADIDYAAAIAQATLDVFEMMIPLELTAEAPLASDAEIRAHVTVMLGLSGDLAGLLTIYCPQAAACAITGGMLGMEVSEIDDDVKDAVGEVANMVAGGLKTALAEAGIGLELAIPSAITGSGYRITAPTGTRKTIVPFRISAGPFWIELKFRRTCC